MEDFKILTLEDMECMESGSDVVPELITNYSNDTEPSSSFQYSTSNNRSVSSSPAVVTRRDSSIRTQLSHENLISQTKNVQKGLNALKEAHYKILAGIQGDYENQPSYSLSSADNVRISNSIENSSYYMHEDDPSNLGARIANVTASLDKIENGIEESTILIAISEGLAWMERENERLRLEMGNVVNENESLREELSDTQKQLIEAVAELGINLALSPNS